MTLVWLLVVLAVLCGVALLAVGRGGGMERVPADRLEPDLPADRAVTAADVDAVRLPLAWRGYRQEQVDTVLDRLSAELARRDLEIAQLRQSSPDPAEDAAPVPTPPAGSVAEPAAAGDGTD